MAVAQKLARLVGADPFSAQLTGALAAAKGALPRRCCAAVAAARCKLSVTAQRGPTRRRCQRLGSSFISSLSRPPSAPSPCSRRAGRPWLPARPGERRGAARAHSWRMCGAAS